MLPFQKSVLPAGVFIAVWLVHYVWLGFFPEQDPAQSRWVEIAAPAQASWFRNYVETQSYWLGFSYALSLAFAAVALRRYREQRLCASRNLAIGGATFSGGLAVVGCYLIGCCGSPMLAVYLSLFGAQFLPLAKPFIALVTTVFIGIAWWWMNRLQEKSTINLRLL